MPRGLLVAGIAWIALCTASLAWSVDPRYSWEELQREVGYGLLAFAVFFAASREPADLHAAVRACLAGAVLLGAAAWLARAFPTVPLAERYLAIEGSLSTQLVTVAPMLLILAARAPLGLAAPARATGATAVLLAAAGFATENRMMWIALMVAVACVAVAYRRGGAAHVAAGSRKAFIVALAAMAIGFVASSAYKATRYYPANATTAESFAFDERPLIWDSAGELFDHRPWLGHGYGREIVGDGIADGLARRGSGHWWLRHGHNVFMDAGLQMGVVGIAAYVALLAMLLRAFAAAGRTQDGWPLAAAGIAMTVALIAKNLTDDFYYRPNSLVFWALCGMLLGLAGRSRRSA